MKNIDHMLNIGVSDDNRVTFVINHYEETDSYSLDLMTNDEDGEQMQTLILNNNYCCLAETILTIQTLMRLRIFGYIYRDVLLVKNDKDYRYVSDHWFNIWNYNLEELESFIDGPVETKDDGKNNELQTVLSLH